MQSQQRQQMQDQYYYKRRQPVGLTHQQLMQRHRLSPEQQAEQKPAEQLAQLTREQRRQEHPTQLNSLRSP
jgi:hypothetical protein